MGHRSARAMTSIIAGVVFAIAAVVPVLAATRNVTIAGFAYSPDPVTVNVGDTVRWTNNDAVAHTATGSGFNTGSIAAGASKSVTFNSAGTFAYRCTIHPSMTGTVVVKATSGGTAPSTDMASIDPNHDGTWLSIVLAAIGVVMLVGTVVVERLLRRRTS
jgi:plastocyanin